MAVKQMARVPPARPLKPSIILTELATPPTAKAVKATESRGMSSSASMPQMSI